MPLRPVGEVQLSYQPVPPKAPAGKHIHPRRALPLIKPAPRDDAETDAENSGPTSS